MIPENGADDAEVSLSGNLEDVPLADVLQFIHLGRRTGTLSLTCDGSDAEIGFHNGQIVSARSPSSRRLGERLVELGHIDREVLEEGLASQRVHQPRQSLGSILVTSGCIDAETLRREIESQIAETVYELVTWTRGVFKFTLDELHPVDDIGMFPGDLIPHIDLNTQMVLLEATRIFDERNRGEEGSRRVEEVPGSSSAEMSDEIEPRFEIEMDAEPEAEPEEEVEEQEAGEADLPDPESLASLLAGLETSAVMQSPPEQDAEEERLDGRLMKPVRLQILTADSAFFDSLARHFNARPIKAVRIRPHEAGIGLHGELPPIVIFDLRHGAIGPQDIRALRRSRPRAPIVAVVDEGISISKVIEAGALAALPAEQGAVISCVESVLRNRLGQSGDDSRPGSGKAGLARLRRILGDLRSGLLSATVALNLLHIISESVERAVLFLVREDQLSALGAFGFSAEGELLAQATRGFRLPRTGSNPLLDSVEDGQVRSVSFDEAGFPEAFVELLGRPETGQVVIFPVLGSQRVISVIYADNGQTTRAIEDIELLELATAQVGMAFENELLRRHSDYRI